MKTNEVTKKILKPVNALTNLSLKGNILLFGILVFISAILDFPLISIIVFGAVMIFFTQKLSWKLDSVPIVQIVSVYIVVVFVYQWLHFNEIEKNTTTFEISDVQPIIEAKFLDVAGSFSYTLNGTLFNSLETKFLIADQERFLINCHLETRTTILSPFNQRSNKFVICDNATAELLNQKEIDEENKKIEKEKKEKEILLNKRQRLNKFL